MSTPAYGERAIRVALIGYGRAGQTFHTPLIRSTPGLDLAVVVSSRPARVHADLPQVIVTATPAAVWTDTSVDMVVIATRRRRMANWQRPRSRRANTSWSTSRSRHRSTLRAASARWRCGSSE